MKKVVVVMMSLAMSAMVFSCKNSEEAAVEESAEVEAVEVQVVEEVAPVADSAAIVVDSTAVAQ